MKRKSLVRSLIAAGVIAAGIGGYAQYDPSVFPYAIAASASASAVNVSARPVLTSALPDFTGIVTQNGAAVVNISVTGKSEKIGFGPGMQGMDPNDPFFQFFRQFRVPTPHGETPMHGMGSG